MTKREYKYWSAKQQKRKARAQRRKRYAHFKAQLKSGVVKLSSAFDGIAQASKEFTESFTAFARQVSRQHDSADALRYHLEQLKQNK